MIDQVGLGRPLMELVPTSAGIAGCVGLILHFGRRSSRVL